MIGFLARDRVSWLVLAIGLGFVVVAAAGLWPAGTPGWVAQNSADAVMVAVLVVLTLRGRSAIAVASERSFWLLLGVGYSLLLAAHALYGLAGGDVDDGVAFVGWSLLVTSFYVIAAFALDLRPHIGDEKKNLLPWMQRLESSGVLVVGLGLFVYFTVIPLVTATPQTTGTRAVIILAGLDAYLCLRLVESFRTSQDRRWSATYALLFAASFIWLAVDLSLLLGRMNFAGRDAIRALLDWLWLPPYLALAWAIRLRMWTQRRDERTDLSTDELQTLTIETVRGTLWFHAGMLPVLHVILETAGLLDAGAQLAQQGVALAVLLVNGILAVVYQRRLESENVKLAGERAAAVEAARQAYHDPLTGLPNRYLLLDHLRLGIASARRDNRIVAVFFIDIDRFKTINDSLGHSAGDQLLVQIASRFTYSLRSTDTLARLGGDEFIVVAPGLHEKKDVLLVGNKLLDSLRPPFTLETTELFVTASIGVALFPDSGGDDDALLRDADIAMYRAKSQGGAAIEVYDAERFGEAVSKLGMETMLRRAVFDEAFVLHFQPIIDIRHEGKAVGTEALIRWLHPERGLLPPGEFLELAESSGVTSRLTPWLLEEACMWAARWRRSSGVSLRMAVNLSARQFLDNRFAQHVEAALAKSGIEGSQLELEVTESVAMQSVERMIQTLTTLKKLHVRVAIDDFGTGYSSLYALRTLPIDTLKVDKSFVAGIATNHSDAAITSTILAVANTLGLEVVAEGVETADQLDTLSRLGCNLMQGYLFSPPVPPEGIPDLLGESLLPRGRE